MVARVLAQGHEDTPTKINIGKEEDKGQIEFASLCLSA